MAFDYRAFRDEYLALLNMSEFQRCNRRAEQEKQRRAEQEAAHVWRDEYALEWETAYTNRPVEDALFVRLQQQAVRRLGLSAPLDPVAEVGAEVVREVLRELRHEAALRALLKARGVTLAYVEIGRGQAERVEVELP